MQEERTHPQIDSGELVVDARKAVRAVLGGVKLVVGGRRGSERVIHRLQHAGVPQQLG